MLTCLLCAPMSGTVPGVIVWQSGFICTRDLAPVRLCRHCVCVEHTLWSTARATPHVWLQTPLVLGSWCVSQQDPIAQVVYWSQRQWLVCPPGIDPCKAMQSIHSVSWFKRLVLSAACCEALCVMCMHTPACLALLGAPRLPMPLDWRCVWRWWHLTVLPPVASYTAPPFFSVAHQLYMKANSWENAQSPTSL